MMHYGVDTESLPVFLSPKYVKKGILSDHNKKALMISIIPARGYRLSVQESLLINYAYQNYK